ncbi:MAG: NAD(P)-binding domain-containing protein [Methanomassiliicoccales archaeon]|nr:NAD(P)-binding domain-containing protein [Methanomassiliicoccales archaeon]
MVGFIGLGNMGSALAAGLLESGAVAAGQVLFVNRSLGKAEGMVSRFPGTELAASNGEVAERSDMIFISVRTDQVPVVLKEISPLRQGAHLIVTNGGLTTAHMESICHGPVSKLIPSVTMEVGHGVSLLCHGDKVDARKRLTLEGMLSETSLVKVIPEDQFEVATDLTSCGPALIAEMMAQFSESGVRHGKMDQKEAREMVLETLLGTAVALYQGMTIEELKSRVATKGGITEQGLKVLQDMLPEVFDRVMDETKAKHASVRERLTARLDG